MERLIIEEFDNYTVSSPVGGVTSTSKKYCAAHPHPNPSKEGIAVRYFNTNHEALAFINRFNQAIDPKDGNELERVVGEKALSRLNRQIRYAQEN